MSPPLRHPEHHPDHSKPDQRDSHSHIFSILLPDPAGDDGTHGSAEGDPSVEEAIDAPFVLGVVGDMGTDGVEAGDGVDAEQDKSGENSAEIEGSE